MVPHLTTALVGPLQDLERRIIDYMPEIERWLRTQWQEHQVPFYTSVDLRNAGFKLAPVDTNLFPGGFNNLNPSFLPLCVQAVQTAVERVCPDARGVLLIPENHTRNMFYLRNVATLEGILRQAGMRVRIGSLNPEITTLTKLDLGNGSTLTLEPVVRNGRRVGLYDFDPCMVLLNNDLSAGSPSILVRNADEVVGLNRKQRNKMAVVKEGLEVSSVLIQEGVPTFESINEAIAEPVVYMIDRFVVGGFRVHTARGKDENLNAPGAQFVPLAFESPCIPDLDEPADCAPNRFYAYGVVARLAQLAASIEIEELETGAFAEPVTA